MELAFQFCLKMSNVFGSYLNMSSCFQQHAYLAAMVQVHVLLISFWEGQIKISRYLKTSVDELLEPAVRSGHVVCSPRSIRRPDGNR